MASVHPKPNQVSSLSPQVILEEGCTIGRQADKVISHYPNKQGPNGHLKNSLTAHSQEATKKQERALETKVDLRRRLSDIPDLKKALQIVHCGYFEGVPF